MKKGFTLLELIVVIIIIGILGTLGVTQYTKVVEKGRSAEAKMILGQMRNAQEAYKLEKGNYTGNISDLGVGGMPADCTGTTHYFSYVTNATTGTATRCGTGTGKTPGAPTYNITIDYGTATWGGNY